MTDFSDNGRQWFQDVEIGYDNFTRAARRADRG